MDDTRTMAQLLEAPTEGYEDAIVVPEITVDNFELKHGLLNLVHNKQFFGHDKEDPHAHIRYFNKITSTMKFPNVPSTSVKLMLFPFSLEGAARIWLEKEPPRSIQTWDDLDSLNSAAGGNFLDKMPRDCLRIIESKSKVCNLRNKSVVAKVSSSTSTPGISSDVAELKDMVKALLLDKKHQSPAPITPQSVEPSVKLAVEHANSRSKHAKSIDQSHGHALLKFHLLNTGTTFVNSPSTRLLTPKEDLKVITTQLVVCLKRSHIPITSSPKVMERETEVTKDTMPPTNNGSTEDVQPPVVPVVHHESISEPVNAPVSASRPNQKALIPFPSRRNDERRLEKANDQIEKFYEIF
ncbi:hypothetical protein Tco_0445918 [Tanacetum coccineum]